MTIFVCFGYLGGWGGREGRRPFFFCLLFPVEIWAGMLEDYKSSLYWILWTLVLNELLARTTGETEEITREREREVVGRR